MVQSVPQEIYGGVYTELWKALLSICMGLWPEKKQIMHRSRSSLPSIGLVKYSRGVETNALKVVKAH